MDTIDLDDVATAAIVFALCAGVLGLCILMDARRLPLGRVKYVPWTFLTLVFVLATAMAGRQAFIDYLRS